MNRVAKRFNRMITEGVKTLLYQGNLPKNMGIVNKHSELSKE